MATERMTSAEVLAVNSAEEAIGVIVEKQFQYPEWQVIPANPVAKTTYRTLVRTSLPDVGFRAINVGRERKSPGLEARIVECKVFDASWEIDKAAATGTDWGMEAAFNLQRSAHIQAEMKAVAEQVWYGTAADSNGFVGLTSLADDLAEDTVVNAGGSTANTGSSVFLVKLGTDAVSFAWGNDGLIEASPIRPETLYEDGDVKRKFPGYVQDIGGWVGLQTTNQASVVRIANLTADSGNGLDDDLLYTALERFHDLNGSNPDAIFMGVRSTMQLRQSRVATNATGAPAPLTYEVGGINNIPIPVYVTSAISKTEPLVVEA